MVRCALALPECRPREQAVAFRHPHFPETSKEICIGFVRTVQTKFADVEPIVAAVMEMGFDPQYDTPIQEGIDTGVEEEPSIEMPVQTCDLCDDADELRLFSQCHPGAPLRAERTSNSLQLSCYVPECGRQVASFPIAEVQP